jgi:hypothetical protein
VYRTEAPVERKFAEKHRVVDLPAFEFPRRAKYAHRQRQVEGGTLLAHIGRREIDHDAPHRKRISGILNCGRHPFAALPHRDVGEADHDEAGQLAFDMRFDADENALMPCVDALCTLEIMAPCSLIVCACVICDGTIRAPSADQRKK